MFLHMNNASYIRVAELARWRLLPQTGILPKTISEGWLFLAVEQTATYAKPIMPFQRYEVETTLTSHQDKWLMYEHKFVQCKDKVKEGKEPVVYATIKLRAVLKRADGRTIRHSELNDISPFNRELMGVDDDDSDDEKEKVAGAAAGSNTSTSNK